MPLSQSELIEFIRNDLGISDAIAGDTELFSSGVLDSVSMVSLITFIEQKADVTIQPADVTLENFDTVDAIIAHVGSLD